MAVSVPIRDFGRILRAVANMALSPGDKTDAYLCELFYITLSFNDVYR